MTSCFGDCELMVRLIRLVFIAVTLSLLPGNYVVAQRSAQDSSPTLLKQLMRDGCSVQYIS